MVKRVMLAALVLMVLAVSACQSGLNFYEPKPAKVYREHRREIMAARGFDNELTSSTQWKLKIKECKVKNNRADIVAEEITAKIPPNAASFVFATYVKRELKVQMWKKGDTWKVMRETVVSEEVSTHDDRKP